MNGRHPIDDLFARTLRDAEATPPPAVWEGIVRERGKGKRAAAKRRGRWGLAALLLLLLGVTGYWLAAPEKDAASSGNDFTELTPSPSGEVSSASNTDPDAAVGAEPHQAPDGTRQVEQAVGASHVGEQQAHQPDDPSVPGSIAGGTNQKEPTQGNAHGGKDNRSKTPVVAVENSGSAFTERSRSRTPHKSNTSTDHNKSSTSAGKPAIPLSIRSSSNAGGPASGLLADAVMAEPGTSLQATSERHTRISPDIHLVNLTGLITPFTNNTAPAPGPLLHGKPDPAYVVSNGHWWLAAQAEWSMLNGSWKGTGQEVPELNKSERWRGGRAMGLATGRTWLNGWSVGLGFGVTTQRARFLRREEEPAQAETITDTTWTIIPMGMETNYTWDIVETVVVEPGVPRDYSATNSYTRLRIAPEVGRELLRNKRWALSARLAPILMVDIGRKGTTIVPSSAVDTGEPTTTTTGILGLGAASLDERFPMAFAVSAGLELRYRLCERWSLGVLPTFTYWIPGAEGPIPALSMNELGGAVRLRYDLPHSERRVK